MTARHVLAISCTFFGLAALSLLALRFGFVVVTVEGRSMYPALRNGDRVLVLRKWPETWLRKGQIVLVDPWLASFPSKTEYLRSQKPFIKRIAAVAGETLVTSITDLPSALRPSQLALHDQAGQRTWHIPARSIFVRGDNRPAGRDSLTWGPIPSATVLGVVIAKLPSSKTIYPASQEQDAGVH